MSDESGIQQFRVFGEDAPGWLVWGLVGFGLVGFVATANLSLPLLDQEYLSQFLARSGVRGGSQVQSRPVPPSGTPTIANSVPKDVVPESDEPKTEVAASGSAEIAESERAVKASKVTADSSLDVSGRVSPVAQASSFASEVLSEPLGPTPDLLAGLRFPRPIVETSPSEEKLDGSPGSDSEHESEAVPVPAAGSQPPDGNGGESETRRVEDCAPLFLVSFSSAGVEPVGDGLASKAQQLADWLRKHPTARVYLEGHTDGVGHEEFNLVLSHRRAKAVADILLQAGVPMAQLATRAYGESMPADPQPRSGRNRRVSMRIADGPECIPAVGGHDG